MIKRTTVLWGPSLSELNEGKDHLSLKSGYAHITELKKSTKPNHQAYRLVQTIFNGDFAPSKETIYVESESERRLEKRLSNRSLNKA